MRVRCSGGSSVASGDWINYSKVASDAEIAKETIRRYFRTLQDTLLAFRLSPFPVRLRASLAPRGRLML